MKISTPFMQFGLSCRVVGGPFKGGKACRAEEAGDDPEGPEEPADGIEDKVDEAEGGAERVEGNPAGCRSSSAA